MNDGILKNYVTVAFTKPRAAADKSPYFAINPAVGGNPARDNIKRAIKSANHGCLEAKPR